MIGRQFFRRRDQQEIVKDKKTIILLTHVLLRETGALAAARVTSKSLADRSSSSSSHRRRRRLELPAAEIESVCNNIKWTQQLELEIRPPTTLTLTLQAQGLTDLGKLFALTERKPTP
jgi:hypothetical protein